MIGSEKSGILVQNNTISVIGIKSNNNNIEWNMNHLFKSIPNQSYKGKLSISRY